MGCGRRGDEKADVEAQRLRRCEGFTLVRDCERVESGERCDGRGVLRAWI